MKKILAGTVAALMMSLGMAQVLVPATAEYAAAAEEQQPQETPNPTAGSQSAKGYVKDVGGTDNNLMGTVKIIINVVLGIVGIIAVVMVIVGGISMATSQGDTAKVAKGRNTVLYGVVGLVVALLAFAIVNFVLTSVF